MVSVTRLCMPLYNLHIRYPFNLVLRLAEVNFTDTIEMYNVYNITY